ncbi:hypothetical protein JXJ21_05720 [candidate division KSB1 bacterium]|nr:hypothetical protein [candidate division KSB1 bacterium]
MKLSIAIGLSLLIAAFNGFAGIIPIGPKKLVAAGEFPMRVTLEYDPAALPETLQNPKQYIHAAYFNGIHWIRLPRSIVQPEKHCVDVAISHSGEYQVVCQPEPYGLSVLENPMAENKKYLLLIPECATSAETWSDLINYFTARGYNLIQYDYPPGQRIEQSAKFLAEELRRLHQTIGGFKFNIVAQGVGGLIANVYYGQDALYQNDIDKLIVCLGTPFRASKMTDAATLSALAEKLMVPNQMATSSVKLHQLWFYHDALGESKVDLTPNSEAIRITNENHSKHSDDSIRIEAFSGINPIHFKFAGEEIQDIPELLPGLGDGYVALESSRLTPIERVPFELTHFELPRSRDVFRSIEAFLNFEKFNWSVLFKKIADPQVRKKIANLWYQEIHLYYQDSRSVEFFINFNKNILRSVPENSLLFTNGDLDTFPALYLQEVENYRRDIAIINLSLFNLPEMIKYFKSAYQLPTSLNDAQIDALHIQKIGANKAIECLGIRVPLDDKPWLRVQDQILLDVVKNNRWQRSLYFAVTVADQNLLFPEKNFELEGLVKRLRPEAAEDASDYALIHKYFHETYTFEGPFDRTGCLEAQAEPFVASLATNYSSLLLKLAYHEIDKHNLQQAERYLSFAKRFKSDQNAAMLTRIEGLIESKSSSGQK